MFHLGDVFNVFPGYYFGLQESRGITSNDGSTFFFQNGAASYLCSQAICKKVLNNLSSAVPSKNGVWVVNNNALNYCNINSGCSAISSNHSISKLFGGNMSGVYAASFDGNISYCDFSSCKLLSNSLIIASQYFIDDVENLFVLDSFGKLNYCNKEECIVLSDISFNKIQKAMTLEIPLKSCSGSITENSIACPTDGKTPMESTVFWNLVGDSNSACSTDLCESYCSEGYFKQNNECIIESLCGNGSSDVGETCSNCPSDIICSLGEVCVNGACVTSSVTSTLKNSISVLEASYSDTNLNLNLSCLVNSDINISVIDSNKELIYFTTAPCLSDSKNISFNLISEQNETYSILGEIDSPCQVCTRESFVYVQRTSQATIPDGNIFSLIVIVFSVIFILTIGSKKDLISK